MIVSSAHANPVEPVPRTLVIRRGEMLQKSAPLVTTHRRGIEKTFYNFLHILFLIAIVQDSYLKMIQFTVKFFWFLGMSNHSDSK